MVYKTIQVPKHHKVKIKSKEWYDKHKNSDGNVLNSDGIVIMNKKQSEYCGKKFFIEYIDDSNNFYGPVYHFYGMLYRWLRGSFDFIN